MYEDNNKDSIYNSEGRSDNSYNSYNSGMDNGSAYDQPGSDRHMYESRTAENEPPRWTSDFDDNNSYNTRTVSSRHQQRKKRRWVIPTVIIAVIVIAAIVCACIFIPKAVNNRISDLIPTTEESADAQAELIETGENTISINETVGGSNSEAVIWNDSESTGTGSVIITDVTDIVEQVYPAVVSITSRTLINKYNNGSYNPFGGLWEDYYDYYYGFGSGSQGEVEQEEVDAGVGSGTIIGQTAENIIILTSYHVVEGSSSFGIGFVDGTSVDGEILGVDEEDDIAVVTVPVSEMSEETLNSISVAKLSTDPAKVGEGVVVIGNALGYGMSVTQGIVSAVDRTLDLGENTTISLIQTDAAINEGNSGGCMLNSDGEIIGISEAKLIITGVEDMCYAIPIATYADKIKELINTDQTAVADDSETGSQEEESIAENTQQGNTGSGVYIGIRGRDITADLAETYGMPQGVYVSSVVSGSGAEAAGIQQGDIIVGFDGQDTTTMEALQEAISNHKAGDTVSVTIERPSGNTYVDQTIDVTLTGGN